MVLSNLGVVRAIQKDFNDAEELYKKALETRQMLRIPNDLGLAQIYNNYGELKRKTGRTRDAKIYHRYAMELRIENAGFSNPSTAESLNNVGGCRDEGKFEAAEACLKAALEIAERYLGDRHYQVAIGHNNFGMLLASQKKFEEAADHVETALATLRQNSTQSNMAVRAVEINLRTIRKNVRVHARANIIEGAIVYGDVTLEHIHVEWKG